MDFSEIVIAFIAGGFSIFVAMSGKKGKYITSDRKEWREYLRNWVKETTSIINQSLKRYTNDKPNYDKLLEAQKFSIITRLNPTRDVILIKKIKRLTCRDRKIFSKIVEDISILLKHDWERVKKRTSLFGETALFNVVFFVLLLIILRNNFENINKFNIDHFLYELSFIIFPYVLLKLIYLEFNKLSLVRRINTSNLLVKNEIRMNFKIIELLFIIVYFFIVSFISQEGKFMLIKYINISVYVYLIIIFIILISIFLRYKSYISNTESEKRNIFSDLFYFLLSPEKLWLPDNDEV